MIDAIRSEDPIRSKIEALGTTLSLPTVRKALGVLEGAHASDKRFGADDVMDIRIYEPGDEAKRIDWKTSARVGRPMVVQRERPSTSRAWLLLDVGQEMTGTCVSGEQVHQVAANALCMFAALSLRRGDEVSIVFGDSGSITRVPFNGGLTQFEQTLDNALQRDWNKPRNIDALLEYARRIRDRDALVVIATDEHALKERHVESIRRIARTHPMVLIDVATINPFDNSHARDVFDAGSDRRIPAFLRTGKTAQEVRTHREYLSASIRHELNRCGSTVIRADSSERMFREFRTDGIRIPYLAPTRNQLKAPSSLTLGGKAESHRLVSQRFQHTGPDSYRNRGWASLSRYASSLPWHLSSWWYGCRNQLFKPTKKTNRGRSRRIDGPRRYGMNASTMWWTVMPTAISEERKRSPCSHRSPEIYVSTATGSDVRNQTLTDIEATPRTTGNQHGLTLLRQTIEALYPPEFADAERNHTAREATVEQAGEWVANLVERWR